MKIINDLTKAQIENNKKDTFATRMTIFLAVILLGTIIFIIGSTKIDEYNYILSMVGDYQVSFSGVNKDMLHTLASDEEIEHISFDQYIETDLNSVLILNGECTRNLEGLEIVSGRKAEDASEIIVPTRFLGVHKEYKVDSNIILDNKEYMIVGEYDDHGSSMEEFIMLGVLEDERIESLLNTNDDLVAFVYYKNPRDTYPNTKELCKELELDYSKALNTGRMYINQDYLENKLIYPTGIIPPRNVIVRCIESYGISLLLVLLFAAMIYGAFDVWNNRDIKEISLLKSVGMTEKQINRMIRRKALTIGVVPILVGTVISYVVTNLILYLMWLNNSMTYKNMSKLFGEKMLNQPFHLARITPLHIALVILLSFLTVYLSAIVPAKKSAKLNIVEGISGNQQINGKLSDSHIEGNVVKTLANDYFKAYRSTYRNIMIAMLLSAMVMTLTIVSKSYRSINSIYGSYADPYNFSSKIYSESKLNENMLEDLAMVKNIDEKHIYQSKNFKFYLNDNDGFVSETLNNAFNNGAKNPEDLYVKVIGLSTADFEEVISMNHLNADTEYIMLNKIPDCNNAPYAFRKYIDITDEAKKEIAIRYSADTEKTKINVGAYIDEIPFELEGQQKNGIYVFAKMNQLERIIETLGKDDAEPANMFMVKIKTAKESIETLDECEKIISTYSNKNDHFTSTDVIRDAMNQEQVRNETMLNLGTQLILIILMLSNAYNSFHGNLRARKKEFELLYTAGMTDQQIKKMIYNESLMLLSRVLISYIGIFIIAIVIRSKRSPYEFMFIFKKIVLNMDYLPIIMMFITIVVGIVLAIRSGIKKELNIVAK